MASKTAIKSRGKISPNKINLLLDLGIALAFVVEMEEHFTGLRNHELLGLAFGAALIVHIVLHWRWVLGVTRHFFQKLIHESRLNYLLNLALFVDMIVIVVTGIAISRTLGISFGLDRAAQMGWQRLHILTSELSLILVGLHVAMHWKWILTHARKYLFSVRLPRRKPTTDSALPIPQAK
jgi:hypothetical protein